MSAISFLLAEEWNKTDGKLEAGDEVTVDGEFYIRGQEHPKINQQSYWAVVSAHIHGNLYTVEDQAGKTFNIERNRLRLRKRHSICCAHISDDKKHDRFAMQHFTTKELNWLEEYMKENFDNDIPEGKITHLHQHSDNAGSHFKSTGSLEYFTSLIRDRGGATECRYVYSFGAPGHGKGFFDGLGGALKNRIHSLIKGTKTGGDTIAGTNSGYIANANDVHDALQEYFEHGRDGLRKRKAKNKVNKFKFFKSMIDDNPIRRTEETFTSLEKINSCYQFCVTNVGIVHARNRSCFCLKCISDLTDGSLNWGPEHHVKACVSSLIQTTSIYNFIKRPCTKLTGTDVAIHQSQRNQSRNEMASQLTPGSWIIFNSQGDNDQPIWLGRAMPKAEWSNSCIKKNNARGEKIIDGAKVARGGYAINVQWYTQKVIGILEYVLAGGDNAMPIVSSNHALILAGFDDNMNQVHGSRTRVPRRRTVRSNNTDDSLYSVAMQNLQTSEGDWYRREYGNLWSMNVQIRDEALDKAGLS